MRSLTRLATALGLIGFVLAAAAGAFVGVRAGASASEPGLNQVRIIDPVNAAGPPEHAWFSAGGFSGFGAAALPGEVITGGALVSVEPAEPGGRLVFRDGGRQTTVRYLETVRLFELVNGKGLATGDTVVLRFVDNDIVSVLLIPPPPPEPEPTPEPTAEPTPEGTTAAGQ